MFGPSGVSTFYSTLIFNHTIIFVHGFTFSQISCLILSIISCHHYSHGLFGQISFLILSFILCHIQASPVYWNLIFIFINQFFHTSGHIKFFPRHLMYMQDFESRHGVPPRSAEVPLHLSPDVELTLRFTYDKITAL